MTYRVTFIYPLDFSEGCQKRFPQTETPQRRLDPLTRPAVNTLSDGHKLPHWDLYLL